MHKKIKMLLLTAMVLTIYSTAFTQTSKTIIILDFELKQQGMQTASEDLGSWISAQIQAALVKSPYLTVVERNRLDEVMKEQALSQTGIMDERTAIQVGKIIGAQKILMGEYQYSQKKRYNISSRLVDIETGKVEVQRIISDIKKKEVKKYTNEVASVIIARIKNQVALENIAKLENPHSPFQVKLSTPKESYSPGEMLTFTIEAEKNCYIYVFDIGTSGKIHLLFPNKMQQKNFLKAGKKIQIENIRVSPPTGTETVKAIATMDSLSYQQLLESSGSQATFQSFGEDVEQFSRDLEVMVSPLAKERWNSDLIRLEIKEK
ncbi:DUF4384 domain-containing protein [candidate division KSB1 bacterium]|nr:DUF4384 domain-containing protein [candidate division KSB1 bacterium]